MDDNLFEKVVSQTGLPEEIISDELGQLLKSAGIEKNQMTMDDLRDVLSNYLQDVLLKVRDELKE